MKTPLSTSDFALISAVCEVRYSNAYFLFDRTGQIIETLRESLTNLELLQATPQQTSFKSDEGAFGLEIAAGRVRQDYPDPKLETLGRSSDLFFTTVFDQLKVTLLTRIGMRVQWRLDCKSVAEAVEILNAIKLFSAGGSDPFGIGKLASEFVLRWQNDEIGVWLTAKSIEAEAAAELPPEFGADRNRKANIKGLIFDVDYYTMAPVDRGQWQAAEWIPISLRKIRKDLDRLIQA